MILYQKINDMMKKIKILSLSVIISAIGYISLGFANNYFEVSKNLDIFGSLYKELNTYYVDETEPGELMKTGIDAMLASLDPFTNYIPESQIEDYRFMTTGQYGGIGALIHSEEGKVIISEPYKDFPAYKAGLKAGDILLEIDGKKLENKTTSDVSNILKGQPNTSIVIKLKRPGVKEELTKTLTREIIKIEDVPYSGVLEGNVGYIKLISFTQTSSKEFTEALKKLRNQKVSAYIIDLRGNGGGLLNEAVNIVNTMIPKGKLVVETKGKLQAWNASYRALNNPIDTITPIVVLVNGSSASASEIVAGALQDYDRGVIVGHQTYGKGLVQMTRPLSYNAQLKVTVAKYYIPSGRCIQKIDYSHRNEDGEAEVMPDSLIKSYQTLGSNRTVFDGKGIKPDVESEKNQLSHVSAALFRNYHIFHFANQYSLQHDSISEASMFELSDEEYIEFMDFMKERDFSYTTESEQKLNELKDLSKKEKSYDEIMDELQALETELKEGKENDLFKFKEEIKLLLENEIVSRYYYQEGRIKASLANDDAVIKARDILTSTNRYKNILSGSVLPKE